MEHKTYRIKDWDRHFEKAQTRKCRTMTWVAIPNRQDGSGYRRVMAHKDAVDLFAAWNAILQIASKMPVRGVLYKDGRSLIPEDLAIASGLPEAIFVLAFRVLTDPRIGWIEVAGSVVGAGWERGGATGQDTTGQNKTEKLSQGEEHEDF